MDYLKDNTKGHLNRMKLGLNGMANPKAAPAKTLYLGLHVAKSYY